MLLLLLLSQHMTVLIIALYILYSHQCKRMQKYEGTWQGPTAIEDTALRWWRWITIPRNGLMGHRAVKGLVWRLLQISWFIVLPRKSVANWASPMCDQFQISYQDISSAFIPLHLHGWFPHCIRHHPHMVRPSYKTFTTLPACSTTWQTAWRWKKWLCSRHMLVILAVVSTWIHKDSEYFKVNQFEQYLI